MSGVSSLLWQHITQIRATHPAVLITQTQKNLVFNFEVTHQKSKGNIAGNTNTALFLKYSTVITAYWPAKLTYVSK